jgi:heptaprenylglyceryl phosphate synthase
MLSDEDAPRRRLRSKFEKALTFGGGVNNGERADVDVDRAEVAVSGSKSAEKEGSESSGL